MPTLDVLQIWATGDASMADKIMAPDVDLYNVVYGGVKKGVDEFKSMIKGIFSVRTAMCPRMSHVAWDWCPGAGP